jgi:hypothetical protein
MLFFSPNQQLIVCHLRIASNVKNNAIRLI